jgi:hypothetical protein
MPRQPATSGAECMNVRTPDSHGQVRAAELEPEDITTSDMLGTTDLEIEQLRRSAPATTQTDCDVRPCFPSSIAAGWNVPALGWRA